MTAIPEFTPFTRTAKVVPGTGSDPGAAANTGTPRLPGQPLP
ncbi:MAG: hypothetical protein ABIP94_22155 [Planctomycetota bacterium]